jgi:hypothetical protein
MGAASREPSLPVNPALVIACLSMRTILSPLLALGLLLAVSGCGKDLTKDIESLAERACACADADCARTVLADLVKLAEANPNPKGDQDKVTKAAQKLGMCVVQKGATLDEVRTAVEKLTR